MEENESKPEVLAFLLAERVIRDESKRFSIIALFNTIVAEVFPTAWTGGAALYLKARGFRSGDKIRVQLVRLEDGERLFESTHTILEDIEDNLEAQIPLSIIAFEKEGPHEFQLLRNDEILARSKLSLSTPQPQKKADAHET